MLHKRLSLLATALFAVSSLAQASDVSQVQIKDLIYGGNGCPQGTARAILSPDAQEISVFFDAYTADSSERASGLSRKSCNLGVGLSVPPGLSAALFSFDFRGFVDVPAGGKSSLRANYFFAGDPVGQTFSRSWGNDNSSVSTDFFERDDFLNITYSDCGDDVIARVNSSIVAQSNPQGQSTFLQVDTLDGAAEYLYHLQWKGC